MIYVGNDIIEVARIRKLISDEKFLDHVYTAEEISYCSKRGDSALHYAGRFAGKEAVKKALLSVYPQKTITFEQINIKHRNDGAPVVELLQYQQKIESIQLSISHIKEFATAVAILEVE